MTTWTWILVMSFTAMQFLAMLVAITYYITGDMNQALWYLGCVILFQGIRHESLSYCETERSPK